MRVIHSGSLDVKSGGPALSTYLTLKGLKLDGVDTSLIMPPLSDGGKLIADFDTIYYTNPVIFKRFGYVRDIRQTLRHAGLPDMYHVQGLWQYMGHAVAKYARRMNRPYMMTLRGMLYPQALKQSSFVKRGSLWLYQRTDLEKAACVQATCMEELEYFRAMGFRNPVAVIPNPIETDGIIDKPIERQSVHRFGYLGRLHVRKRVERLIYAFAHVCKTDKDAELIIIGGGDPDYETFLKTEALRLGLKNVKFLGFLTGDDKDRAIRSLSYLVVPSDFENFGNIVTEALVRGVPVIASKGTPWEILEKNGCGWWIDNAQEQITASMMMAIEVPEEKRIKMGNLGKQLVEERFSVHRLGQNMHNVYKWILGFGPMPESVHV